MLDRIYRSKEKATAQVAFGISAWFGPGSNDQLVNETH